jgi:hypothetical protein
MKLEPYIKLHYPDLPLNYQFLECQSHQDTADVIITSDSELHQTKSRKVVSFHSPLNLYFPLYYISNED